MSNNKQTAVEWLQEQLECFGNKHELQMSWTTVDELFERAKAMEKEQIIETFQDSRILSITNNCSSGEQYYTQTYGGNK